MLALMVARHGDTVVRADASSSAILASAAADIVAHLVDVNLLADVQEERTVRVRLLAQAAADSRAAAVAILT